MPVPTTIETPAGQATLDFGDDPYWTETRRERLTKSCTKTPAAPVPHITTTDLAELMTATGNRFGAAVVRLAAVLDNPSCGCHSDTCDIGRERIAVQCRYTDTNGKRVEVTEPPHHEALPREQRPCAGKSGVAHYDVWLDHGRKLNKVELARVAKPLPAAPTAPIGYGSGAIQ